MIKLRTIILGLVLTLVFLQGQSNADDDWERTLTDGNYTLPYPGWNNPHTLNTLNDVAVTMVDGGGAVVVFNMYDNSKLVMYDNGIGNLNLYDNATASFYGADYISSIFVDSASTGWVKLYAVEIFHNDTGGLWNNGMVGIRWLDKEPGWMTTINLRGTDTYSHIQFVPEPATILFLCLGGLILRKSKK